MKKILVIDDEKAIRFSVQLTFEDTDYQVDTAENGLKGLNMIKQNRYDLVFLDLKMPDMNGVEVLTEIRKENNTLPVYIITAFSSEFLNELNEAVAAGYNFELLNKPLNKEQLIEIVRSVLG